jgi:hypothetical protein
MGWYRSKVFAWRKNAAPVVEAETLGEAPGKQTVILNCPYALGRSPCAFTRYPLAIGPEGLMLEGRKMAMAGTGGGVNERGSMPTLLSDRNGLP